MNYPLTFTPILKQKLWGGNLLRDLLGKETQQDNIGESWELSGVKDYISICNNGSEYGKSLKELIHEYKGALVGQHIYEKFGDDFPLLIKFIDANQNLSVQLHPNDEIAKARHNSFGKTEMWYVMNSIEGQLNIGFNKDINQQDYQTALENNKLVDLLHFEQVEKGDAVFISPGKVHAIGAGVLLAEIQQTSDITYRLYDWDRVDDQGQSRELHTELALDAIDFSKRENYWLTYNKEKNQSSEIKSCEYFTTNYLPIQGSVTKNYNQLDSFVIYMCVDGIVTVRIENERIMLKKGQTCLIPACCNQIQLNSDESVLLEIYR